jgi:hypothetical protein
VHQTKARLVLKTVLGLSDIQWRKFIHFLKSYLAMEEWFQDSNNKDEVNSSRGEISKVLTVGGDVDMVAGITKLGEQVAGNTKLE